MRAHNIQVQYLDINLKYNIIIYTRFACFLIDKYKTMTNTFSFSGLEEEVRGKTEAERRQSEPAV